MGAERFPRGTVGILGVTGVFLAEKFESPTRCIENLAPPSAQGHLSLFKAY